ncbi:transposase [Atopobium sp. oral taxon 416]|nr:transposase [Atopobium sp. oral taxon 416]
MEAIACDMNADFECAFLKRHPHLSVVYDCFHIVKNFNEKVICKVRKDERQGSGTMETARPRVPLKHSTYILKSSADTRKRKDRDAHAGKVVSRGSALFGKQEALQKGGAAAAARGTRTSYPKTSCLLPATSQMRCSPGPTATGRRSTCALPWRGSWTPAAARKTGTSPGLPASWRGTWKGSSPLRAAISAVAGWKAPTR